MCLCGMEMALGWLFLKAEDSGQGFVFTSPYGEGDGTPLQYSCLENPMDGGAWWAAVHGVTKNQAWLSDFTFTFTLTT